MVLGLHMIDNLFNAMHNPVFMLIAGGLAGAAGHLATSRLASGDEATQDSGAEVGGAQPANAPW